MMIITSTLLMRVPTIWLRAAVVFGLVSKAPSVALCLAKGMPLCLIFAGVLDRDIASYYEWLKRGKARIPHFVKHKNGTLMLLAGMYDCATLEGDKLR